MCILGFLRSLSRFLGFIFSFDTLIVRYGDAAPIFGTKILCVHAKFYVSLIICIWDVQIVISQVVMHLLLDLGKYERL